LDLLLFFFFLFKNPTNIFDTGSTDIDNSLGKIAETCDRVEFFYVFDLALHKVGFLFVREFKVFVLRNFTI
jgi:hypothetical protein